MYSADGAKKAIKAAIVNKQMGTTIILVENRSLKLSSFKKETASGSVDIAPAIKKKKETNCNLLKISIQYINNPL